MKRVGHPHKLPPTAPEGLESLPPPLDTWGEIAVTRLSLALTQALQRAANQLDVQSGLAAMPQEAEAMSDAATFARARQRELAREFGRQLEQRYVRACHHRPSILEGYLVDMDAKDLRIIKHERLDDSLAPGLLAETIRYTCWDSLQALGAEFTRLLQVPVNGHESPLAPRVVEAALAETLREQDWNHDAKTWLMRALADHLPRAVGELYRDLLGRHDVPMDLYQRVPPQARPLDTLAGSGADALPPPPQEPPPLLEDVAPPPAVQPAQSMIPTEPPAILAEPTLIGEALPSPANLFKKLSRLKARLEANRQSTPQPGAGTPPSHAAPQAAHDVGKPHGPIEADTPLTTGTSTSTGDSAPGTPRIADLKPGCWLEIREPGTPPRILKLAWVSPLRNLFLMTDQRGDRALSLDAEHLSGLIQAGWANLTPSPANASPGNDTPHQTQHKRKHA